MKALQTFAKMLGLPSRLAEDALHSESAARAVLSRRNLFAAGAALAVGSVLVGGPLPLRVFSNGCDTWVAHSFADLREFDGADGYIFHEDYVDDLFEQAPEKQITICWNFEGNHIDDDRSSTRTLTAARWAQECGRGFLCTTEY